MKTKFQIIPAILAKNKKYFSKDWRRISPFFKHIQIDIMDGILVKNKNNIGPQAIKNISQNHFLEIHLMVKNVSAYAEKWLNLKNIKKITWHYEAEKNKQAIVCLNNYLKTKKIKTGLAINPSTTLAKIIKLIPNFDTIQIMGVTPGRQGQKFQNQVLKKIKKLRQLYPKINIAVDGGINHENIKEIKKAGANLIIVGSYLKNSSDIKKALDDLIQRRFRP